MDNLPTVEQLLAPIRRQRTIDVRPGMYWDAEGGQCRACLVGFYAFKQMQTEYPSLRPRGAERIFYPDGQLPPNKYDLAQAHLHLNYHTLRQIEAGFEGYSPSSDSPHNMGPPAYMLGWEVARRLHEDRDGEYTNG